MKRLTLFLVALLAGLPALAQPTTRPAFVLGVFQPDEVPVDAAGHNATQTWAARGCNTAVLVPQGHDVAGFDYRCTISGLRIVRALAGVQPANTAGLGLLARASDLCPDEPDLNGGQPDALAAENLGAGPTYQSISGGLLLGLQAPTWDDATYGRVLGRYSIVATDIYPVTGWGRPDWLRKVYDAQVRLAQLAPKAERWAFIECSDQRLPWVKAPRTLATQQEIDAEAKLALVGGARGIVWFPQCIGQWSFDATTPDTQAAIVSVNGFCAKYADFLSHGTLKATVSDPKYRGDWTYNGQTLTIVVDLSAAVPVVSSSVAAVSATGSTSQPATTQPFDLAGTTITLPNGKTYTLTPK